MTDFAELAEIRSLVDAYAIAVDTHDEELFESIWTDDGILTVHKAGQVVGTSRPDAVTA